jgi:hypothetical protein
MVFAAGDAARLHAQTNPPSLTIGAAGTNVTVGWNSSGTLQYAPSADGPWATFTGGVSVLSTSSVAATGLAKFFRVVNNGVATTPVALFPTPQPSPLQIQTASLQLLGSPVSAGNTRLVLSLAPGTYSSSNNVITLLMDNGITTLRDDGQFPDQTANDGNFSAVVNITTAEINAWNVALSNLPPAARFSYVFSGRSIVGTNTLQAFPLSNFLDGQQITFVNNTVQRGLPLFPCTGSPLAYNPAKTEMITDLSVVADPTRTWDNVGAPTPFGAGGVGNQNGPWTFNALITAMANTPLTGITPSDFILRVLESYEFPQTINNDVVPPVPAVQSLIIQPWQAATAAEGGFPTGAVDLSIAPFRLLAIANRVDLRANSTYGGSTSNSCVPSELAGEARFVFGFVSPDLETNATGGTNGTEYSNEASNQMTVILEYAVPIDTCQGVQAWGAQWAALNNLALPSAAFNNALQAITDQFTKARANPAQMPNQSAIAQVRINEFLGPEWELRQFNIQTSTGFLIESPVAVTPSSIFNNSSTLESFMAGFNNASFCTVGPLLPTPSLAIPVMFGANAFLGGWAPEGFPTGPNTTSGMFWKGTDCADPCTRHVLSLNACNGCHSQETGTLFVHVSPRAFGVQSILSGFLTGATPPNPLLDPSGCSSVSYSYSDLLRRVQDLNALVTCGCEFEVTHIPLQMTH